MSDDNCRYHQTFGADSASVRDRPTPLNSFISKVTVRKRNCPCRELYKTECRYELHRKCAGTATPWARELRETAGPGPTEIDITEGRCRINLGVKRERAAWRVEKRGRPDDDGNTSA